MKSRYFIVPLLLLSGCSGSINNVSSGYKVEKYTNVAYDFIREEKYYLVCYDYDYTTNKYNLEWHVSPNNIYYVFSKEYVFNENNEEIDNEFYVSGNDYELFVYIRLK